jgi:hypothetical protein
VLNDPIVDEVRAARDAYAKRFNYDLKKIAADLRKKSRARKLAAKPAPAPTKPQASRLGKRRPAA